jgi:predicted DNA binding CopG/RHH family protein
MLNYNNLEREEQEILDLFEQGKLSSVENAADEMKLAMKAAHQHLKKDARINIRLSQFDLDRLRRIAANEGLPYQTLISSVLHKYVQSLN